jgi:hypothetical protein
LLCDLESAQRIHQHQETNDTCGPIACILDRHDRDIDLVFPCVTLAMQNVSRNRAATKDRPFQNQPTSPLRFTAWFGLVMRRKEPALLVVC